MNFEPYLNDYEKVASETSYKLAGMFYSEGFVFVSFCHRYDIEIILESGTCLGMSTELFARALSDVQIYTFDVERSARMPSRVNPATYKTLRETRNRLNKLNNVMAFVGNSRKEIPNLIEANPNKKIAVMIDGPKGWRGNHLASFCLGNENVKFVGVHDHTEPQLGFDYKHISAGDTLPEVYCTHDNQKYRFLDDGVDAEPLGKKYLDVYPKGPGLCVYYKNEIRVEKNTGL